MSVFHDPFSSVEAEYTLQVIEEEILRHDRDVHTDDNGLDFVTQLRAKIGEDCEMSTDEAVSHLADNMYVTLLRHLHDLRDRLFLLILTIHISASQEATRSR